VKTYNHLFDRIVAFDNLLPAARKAQKSKRFKPATALFNFNLEKELLRLQRELLEKRYAHGGYHDFTIYDPKMRLISAAPYRDRVVHHALCNVIEPLFDRSFIFDTYACRKGKGTHAAVDRYTVFARKNRYVLKCDIRKYFPSIDQDILLGIIRRKIKCNDTLWLIEQIVRSRADSGVICYFPGDDLFTPYQRARGLAIGNLTSQFFANLYLDGFDHYVLRFRRKLNKLQHGYQNGCIGADGVKQSIQSWIAHAGHADTYGLRRRILAGAVFQKG
jgi:retron-type reverse transcriptase